PAIHDELAQFETPHGPPGQARGVTAERGVRWLRTSCHWTKLALCPRNDDRIQSASGPEEAAMTLSTTFRRTLSAILFSACLALPAAAADKITAGAVGSATAIYWPFFVGQA